MDEEEGWATLGEVTELHAARRLGAIAQDIVTKSTKVVGWKYGIEFHYY